MYRAFRHDLAEQIVTSWIVCEEILSFHWDEHVSQISDKDRRERLTDTRTYGAAVRLEVLLQAGVLPSDLCTLLHEARRARNALAHRAAMDQNSAVICDRAMREALRHFGIPVDQVPSYVIQRGGMGRPRVAVEPEFAFK